MKPIVSRTSSIAEPLSRRVRTASATHEPTSVAVSNSRLHAWREPTARWCSPIKAVPCSISACKGSAPLQQNTFGESKNTRVKDGRVRGRPPARLGSPPELSESVAISNFLLVP